MITPVILSGGAGSRLWPLSRELHPKQFLSLVHEEKTMLQDTTLRLKGVPDIGSPIVVCNEEQRFMVAEQMRQIGVNPAAIVLEPVGRNTAPAVAVAALQALATGGNPFLLVLPADHVIGDVPAFHRAVETGKASASEGKLVTFGIVPTAPETGYGYIKGGSPINASVLGVDSFVEKPDSATAERYLASGEYFWNSGMFIFSAQRFLEELERFAPQMLAACRTAHANAVSDADFIRLDAEAFASSPSDSIDYAVMEKTAEAVVIPLDAEWSDVGSWSALWEIGARDENGNVLKGDTCLHDVKNCYISSSNRLIAALGVEDHIIIETADAILVARKDRDQDVKVVVNQLKALKRPEALTHQKVYRPWGAYQSVDSEDRFQVKRITVNPGASLSLQMHHHRAEHWIVVKGTARVVKGDEVLLLSENQSTYIPLGMTHRLENPGVIPLELIEVQSGSYLGEDDIVRFEDVYGR